MNERLAKLEALESQRATGQPSQRHEDPSLETTHDATPPSQRRSSVASTELVHPDSTAPRYPVDGITHNEHCVLMAKCHNLTLKAAVGHVLPPRPDATFHCTPVPAGFAIVGVDEIMDGFDGLELEYATGEGELLLRYALRNTCLWRKEHIVLPYWTPPQQTQPEEAPVPESSPARQPSPLPQRTPTEEAPQ